MTGGYVGKMLFVDLSGGTIEERGLAEDVAKNFIGGYGIGARVLYDMMKPGADPLGPDNVLGLVTGRLDGTGALFGGRYAVVCKSPVTGGWNDANSGGFFGPEIKKAGFDALFISGAADKPVYLWIHDGMVEIRDASALWGKDSTETLEALIKETGEKKLRAVVIGPAGERLSPMAAVMNDRHRAAGRGGPGAVMGSKNLKAVAVRGTGTVPVADSEKLKEINRTVSKAMKEGPSAELLTRFGEYGTGIGTGDNALSGDSPVKNWGGVGIVDFGEEAARKLDAMSMDRYKTKKYACANCPLGCGAYYDVSDGKWPVGETSRPEYETSAAFGSMCLNSSAESVIKCNEICNRYGLDTISVGATVAWAIECYENGLFGKEETGGIELTWGNADAIVKMTEAIAEQRGFGEVLALGSAGAAEKLGKGSQYLQTVKGIELPMHDPRFAPGYARTYKSDPSPARHVKGGLGLMQARDTTQAKYDTSNTGPMDLILTTIIEVINASGLCLFSLFLRMPDVITNMIAAVTGWSFSGEDQKNAGIRIINMRHAFNLREGYKPTDFVLPSRSVGEPAQEEGPLAGKTIDHRALFRNFCAAMGWDEGTGKPSRESLLELGGMDDVIKDLYG
jgi:aldehyde:ferredoxin oxidoreductase